LTFCLSQRYILPADLSFESNLGGAAVIIKSSLDYHLSTSKAEPHLRTIAFNLFTSFGAVYCPPGHRHSWPADALWVAAVLLEVIEMHTVVTIRTRSSKLSRSLLWGSFTHFVIKSRKYVELHQLYSFVYVQSLTYC